MKNAKTRLKNIIESDRLIISEDMSLLIEYDLKKLLDNYFNTEGQVKIEVEALKDSYKIIVTATAESIKPFLLIK
ncbi:MAG: hypothetical protein J6R29_02610 [Clostridia bacterium]|nr:hypothetical protein [Clostridia bacterium]